MAGPGRDEGTVPDESKSPDELEAEIEEVRDELGETAAALAEKADVKEQAKRKVSQAKATAQAKKEETAAKARDAAPASAKEGADRAGQFAEQAAGEASRLASEHRLETVAIAGFAAGLVFGWLLARR